MPRRKPPADPTQVSFIEPASTFAEPRTAASRRNPSPARGRVATWTSLHNTGTRIDRGTDARLTAACDQTGKGVQGVWEAAINFYCDKLTPPIPATMPEGSDLEIPRPEENQPTEGTRLVTVRLTSNTRARLVAGCRQEVLGGRDFINDALNDYFDDLGIPRREGGGGVSFDQLL